MIKIIIAEDSKMSFGKVTSLVADAMKKSSVSPRDVEVLAIANEGCDLQIFSDFASHEVFTPADFSSLVKKVRAFLSQADRLALFLDFELEFYGYKIITLDDMRTLNSEPYKFWADVVARSPGCFVRTMTRGTNAEFKAAAFPCHSFDQLSVQLDPDYTNAKQQLKDWLDNDFGFPGGDFPDQGGPKSANGRDRTRADWFDADCVDVPHDPPGSPAYADLVRGFISEYVGGFPDFLRDVNNGSDIYVLHEHLKGFVGKHAAFDNNKGDKGLSFVGALLLIIRGCRSKGKHVKVAANGGVSIKDWLEMTKKMSVVRDPATSRAAGRALYDLGACLGSIGINLSERIHGSERLPIISITTGADLCSGKGGSMCVRDAVLPPLNDYGYTDNSAGATGRALNRFLVMSSRTGTDGHMPMFRVSVDVSHLTLTALTWVD